MRLFWGLVGLLALGCGIAGLVLPLVPTVPFLLLAAWAFSKSSDRLHRWLIGHPIFGPQILNWRERGAISASAKKMASISMLAVFAFSIWAGLEAWVLAVQGAVLVCVAVFIWSRPA